jgi:hypothetical protein
MASRENLHAFFTTQQNKTHTGDTNNDRNDDNDAVALAGRSSCGWKSKSRQSCTLPQALILRHVLQDSCRSDLLYCN